MVNLAQNKSSAAQNGKLDDSMASESSAKPTKMTISGTDNQKNVNSTKLMIASLKELVSSDDLKLVISLL